jgi:hypothetical protein
MLFSVLVFSLAAAPVTPATPSQRNVIFLTWDGVRWQDFFNKNPDGAFTRFWSTHAQRATVLGDPSVGEPFEASNASIKSLPAYQEMMVGAATACDSNLCGRVKEETLLDRLHSLGFGSKMKVVGSWGTLDWATSSRKYPFVDTGLHDDELRPPWGDARKDRDTWGKAMSALEQRPRFLWISLNDADEWGHRGSRDTYVSQLKRYDIWFDELVQKLAAMPGYGENTTIVVTTDHGRGEGDDWSEHGKSHPAARRAFAFALGPGTGNNPAAAKQGGNHRGLRPTLEALLGLAPSGLPIAAFLPASSGGAMAAP